MAAQRHFLKRRGNRWWFQIAVPEDCRTMVGCAVKAENLRTSDAAVAQARALERAAFWKNRFIAIRGGAGELPADAFAAATERALAEMERIAREVADPQDRAERQELIYDLELQRVLEKRGLADASELEDYDLPQLERARLLGVRAAVQKVKEIPPEYREPFSRTAAAYLADRQRPGSSDRLTDQTVAQMEAVYRLYKDHTSDAPLRMTTRKVAAQFFDKLKRLDANWGRSPKTKERTLDDLLALSHRDDSKPLSDRTLFRYRLALSQVWAWARGRDEVTGDDPFEHLAKKGKNDESANAPWSDDAIVAYFAAHPDGSKKGKPDPFFWLPRIALLSGMRLDEICSLRVTDIIEGDGVRCFDIKKGKTSAATRAVPIHDNLLPLLELAPAGGFLFPDLIPGGKDKKRSAQIGKQLGRRFAAIPGGSTFHAFRKNVAGTFERNRVRESEAAQILGHGKKGITYKIYSPHGIPIALRKQLVDLLKLPKSA
jgi:integrase